MINTATFVTLAIFGGYSSGAPEGFSNCAINPNPLGFSFQLFHSMPEDPDQIISEKCLFPLPEGKSIRGLFHFGFSELEYDQYWFVDDKQRVQSTRVEGAWGGNGGSQWLLQHTAAKDGLSRNKHKVMLGTEVVGYLVYLQVANKKHVGLIDLSLQNANAVEVGFYTPFEKVLPGKTPQASRVLLTPKYLKQFSKPALKIMRNEIYARYGHPFKPGGAMEKHFLAQSWYQKLSPAQKPVGSLLTTLEKENIRRIQQAEKR